MEGGGGCGGGGKWENGGCDFWKSRVESNGGGQFYLKNLYHYSLIYITILYSSDCFSK